jgi:hypothetical protein
MGSTTFSIRNVLQLISYTWELSRYFSDAVDGKRCAIGENSSKETWKFIIIIYLVDQCSRRVKQWTRTIPFVLSIFY